MNIFVTDTDPIQSALNLPDKHIVKMPLETCQMLAIIYSDWYYGVGQLHKSDGTPYRTAHGAFRNHPCTQWAAANQYNLAWLIAHGIALCNEYTARYGKRHTCYDPIIEAVAIYDLCFDDSVSQSHTKVTSFTRAMPDDLKYNTRINTIEAYKYYLNTKPWVATNYLRIPSRKPSFIITPMTTSTPNKSDLPVYDFSDDNKIAKALNDAPAVKAMKSKATGLVPAPKKAAPKATKKAGRVVGISADENKFLYELLQAVLFDNNYATMINDNQIAFDKLNARYNNK